MVFKSSSSSHISLNVNDPMVFLNDDDDDDDVDIDMELQQQQQQQQQQEQTTATTYFDVMTMDIAEAIHSIQAACGESLAKTAEYSCRQTTDPCNTSPIGAKYNHRKGSMNHILSTKKAAVSHRLRRRLTSTSSLPDPVLVCREQRQRGNSISFESSMSSSCGDGCGASPQHQQSCNMSANANSMNELVQAAKAGKARAQRRSSLRPSVRRASILLQENDEFLKGLTKSIEKLASQSEGKEDTVSELTSQSSQGHEATTVTGNCMHINRTRPKITPGTPIPRRSTRRGSCNSCSDQDVEMVADSSPSKLSKSVPTRHGLLANYRRSGSSLGTDGSSAAISVAVGRSNSVESKSGVTERLRANSLMRLVEVARAGIEEQGYLSQASASLLHDDNAMVDTNIPDPSPKSPKSPQEDDNNRGEDSAMDEAEARGTASLHTSTSRRLSCFTSTSNNDGTATELEKELLPCVAEVEVETKPHSRQQDVSRNSQYQAMDDDMDRANVRGWTTNPLGMLPPRNRSWTVAPDCSVRVVSYNVLAEVYTDFYPTPYPHCEERYLDWSYRRWLLLQEIVACQADIICLQEVDHYQDFFLPQLLKYGYIGSFKQRTDRKKDGCAIFYRHDIFSLKNVVPVEFDDLSQYMVPDARYRFLTHNIGMAVQLERKPDAPVLNPYKFPRESVDRTLWVANAHLFWDPLHADVKVLQAYYLLSSLARVKLPQHPIILCGDLNSLPDSAVVALMSGITVDSPCRDFKSSTLASGTSLTSPIPLSSAYHITAAAGVNGDSDTGTAENIDPDPTTFTPNFSGCIDYVWFSPSMLHASRTVNVLGARRHGTTPMLPNRSLASDHVAIAADLAWTFLEDESVALARVHQQHMWDMQSQQHKEEHGVGSSPIHHHHNVPFPHGQAPFLNIRGQPVHAHPHSPYNPAPVSGVGGVGRAPLLAPPVQHMRSRMIPSPLVLSEATHDTTGDMGAQTSPRGGGYFIRSPRMRGSRGRKKKSQALSGSMSNSINSGGSSCDESPLIHKMSRDSSDNERNFVGNGSDGIPCAVNIQTSSKRTNFNSPVRIFPSSNCSTGTTPVHSPVSSQQGGRKTPLLPSPILSPQSPRAQNRVPYVHLVPGHMQQQSQQHFISTHRMHQQKHLSPSAHHYYGDGGY